MLLTNAHWLTTHLLTNAHWLTTHLLTKAHWLTTHVHTHNAEQKILTKAHWLATHVHTHNTEQKILKASVPTESTYEYSYYPSLTSQLLLRVLMFSRLSWEGEDG